MALNNLSAFINDVGETQRAASAIFSRDFNGSLQAAGGSEIYKLTIVQNQDSAPQIAPGASTSLIIKAWLPDTFNQDVVADYDTPFSQMIQDRVPSAARNFIRAQLGTALMTQDMTVQVWSGSAPWDFSIPFVFTADEGAVPDVLNKIKALKGLITPGRDAAGFLTAPGPTINLVSVGAQGLSQIRDGLRETAISGIKEGFTALSNVADTLTSSKIFQNVKEFAGSATDSFANAFGLGAAQASAIKATTQSALPQRNADKTESAAQSQNNGNVGQTSSRIKNRISLHVGRFMYFPAVVVTNVGETYNTIFDANGIPVRASVNVNFRTMITPVKAELDQMYRG